jgi:UDP-glucose:(heptosyl)LPS alpha-1,3-glucosyltransferase
MAVNPYHRVRLHLERQLFAPGGYRRIIALTERIRDEVIDAYRVPASDIVVHPQGFDPAQFSAARRRELRAAARARHGYADSDRVVAFVANELERKGFDTLVAALARLDDTTRLLVVGRVDARRARAVAARAGVAGRVDLAGSSQDVAVQLAAADAFALPTRYEPWGLVIVEALASGLPVVTSRLAGAAVAVADGRTGRLLDDPDDVDALADALRWALTAGHDADEISASVAWLRWDAVVERYAELLAEAYGRDA